MRLSPKSLARRPKDNSAAEPHGRTAAGSLDQNDFGATNDPEIEARATASAPDSTSQVSDRLAVLAELSLADLRLEWRRLFRADPPRLSRDIMMRAVAYRQQESAHGGASKVTRRRLMTLAAEFETSGTIAPPPGPKIKPGSRLVREWHGRWRHRGSQGLLRFAHASMISLRRREEGRVHGSVNARSCPSARTDSLRTISIRVALTVARSIALRTTSITRGLEAWPALLRLVIVASSIVQTRALSGSCLKGGKYDSENLARSSVDCAPSPTNAETAMSVNQDEKYRTQGGSRAAVATARTPSRSISIDYLRAFVVFMVVAFHSMLAYLPLAPAPAERFVGGLEAWRGVPVVDSQRWAAAGLIVVISDTFFMALMFFVSGLFVWRSLRSKGGMPFLRDRVLRLGVPFLFGVGVILPVAHYASYLQSSGEAGFENYWRAWWALSYWPSGPMWFVSMLLAFDVVAAGLFALAPHWGERLGALASSAGKGPVRLFAFVLICRRSPIFRSPLSTAPEVGPIWAIGACSSFRPAGPSTISSIS